ncbi:OLC1v1017189C1 [Oldenlandia corymbosa var. corymbosa]|uniref:OLC1v1017189C1 n=1 Tax=Oldenlandia corymbosa var. corymbosa TaxID=529605 RepID=A0AAV1E8V0_OLDCO|nr:OLC1v1017189C1 [Oldenlandia corymbosa var. corymbosa]
MYITFTFFEEETGHGDQDQSQTRVKYSGARDDGDITAPSPAISTNPTNVAATGAIKTGRTPRKLNPDYNHDSSGSGSWYGKIPASGNNDNYILPHFHIRAWCVISQAMDKKKVLLELLNQINPISQLFDLSEHDLVEKLWGSLKGRRFLILLDDLWDIEAWNSLGRSFPNDTVASRILLTSRHSNVAPREMLHSQEPHLLRQLNVDESMELLKRKLFPGNDGWTPALADLTMQITAYSFPEDADVSADRLLYLWMPEGFVRKDERKRIQDIAKDYLNGLIDRSLIMVSKAKMRWWNQNMPHFHYLLHEFCLQKAKDEHFFPCPKGT